ncbi:sensor histidine kinase [Paenibacillus sp. 2RAB27]|uniref:cache domain-containing sensor histidine kinase n=1 Tax=Paenibacillus sp. 2RAB27 TaxID=3232991 RepID=UPI003F987FEA
MINHLTTNERLTGYMQDLSNSHTNTIDKYRLSKDFEKYLYNIRQENDFIDSILVITSQSQFSSDHQYLNFELNGIQVGSRLEKERNLVLLGKASESIIPPYGSDQRKGMTDAIKALDTQMFFAANIMGSEEGNNGVILILLNPHYLKEAIPYNENISLFDTNHHLIFSGSEDLPSVVNELKGVTDPKDGFVFHTEKGLEAHYTTIPFNDFQLVYLDRMDFYYEQLIFMAKLTAATFMLAVLVSFVSSRVISNKVLSPVYKVMRLFKTYDFAKNQGNDYKELTTIGKSHLNLRDRFLLYFIITILLPLIVYIVVFYWQTSKIAVDDLKKSHYSLFEETASHLEHDINQKEVLMARISLDTAVQEDIAAKDSRTLEKELLYENHDLGLNRDVISIYDRSNSLIFSNKYKQIGELDPAFYNVMKTSGRMISYHLTKDDFGNASIVLGMPIISLDRFPEIVGYITVDLDSGFLSNLYGEFKQYGSESFILDRENRVVSHPVTGQIGRILDLPITSGGHLQHEGSYGGKYFVFVKEISGVPWRFISKYNDSDVQQQVIDLFLSNSYIFFLIFLLMLLFSFYMSQRMLKPLGKLNQMLNEFELGESHRIALESVSGIDEVDLLSSNFSQMVRRIDDLVHETLVAGQERVKLEYEKKEIQMIALQSQINPHFLYNTLDNLIYLVVTKEVEKAVEMISSLSRLFRYITNREQMIRMKDEIKYNKAYIDIMSCRYDNFQCIWHIDDDVMDCGALKLILQPLIENAIHHGARQTRKHVTIEISVLLQEDAICIIVKDNALGMQEEQLQEVRKQLADPGVKKAGIYNVNARIKLNYGEAYGLNIDSRYGEGTMVTILLPANQ